MAGGIKALAGFGGGTPVAVMQRGAGRQRSLTVSLAGRPSGRVTRPPYLSRAA